MKNFKRVIIRFCIVFLSLNSISAHAWFWGKKKGEDDDLIKVNPIEKNQSKEALEELNLKMTSNFQTIETLLDDEDFGEALKLAKQTLDLVRVQTGIDPKARLREKFFVATTFPSAASSIDDLSRTQAEDVIRTISNYRAGLFLDIMNLSKRTTLLYIKAFQKQLSQMGGLLQEDKNKIVNDLVKASLIPMVVEGKNGTRITVFDEDVANEDHTYLFNRELKLFLINNNELEITEEKFLKLKSERKTQLLGGKGSKSSGPEKKAVGLACMSHASSIRYSDDRNSAQKRCFNKYYRKTKSHGECYSLAIKIEYSDDKNDAQVKCANKFN